MTPELAAGPESDAWLGEELRRSGPVPEAPSRWVASFPALVLLVTFTLGVGVAASFLAPGISGFPSIPFGGGGAHATNNTTLPLPNITNPTPNGTNPHPSPLPNPNPNSTKLPNGTPPGKGNSTKNGTGGGNGTTTGPCTVNCPPGNGTGGGPTNNSSGPTHTVNPPIKRVAVDRLPWFTWQPQLLIAVSAVLAIGSLFALVAFDAVRPPPPSPTDPWRFQRRRDRRQAPPVSPQEAVGEAARRLEAALAIGYSLPREELRGHIFALYAALLEALGPALGELSARTPREVEWLSVRYLGVSPETARWLTGLFEEARYSTHPIRPEAIGSARAALVRLLQELQRFVGR
jgi:hypothetical protein